jgi:hypothetical protein
MELALNVPQQLFAIFFAIDWGTSSNVWSRWKPFQWPMVCKSSRIRTRTELSLLILNLVPLLYFAWIQWILSGKVQFDPLSRFGFFCQLIVSSIGPAFAVFGFYRIWIGIVESCPNCFYYDYANDLTMGLELRLWMTDKIEPSIRSLDITRWSWWRNIVVGAGYVILAMLASLLKLPVIK